MEIKEYLKLKKLRKLAESLDYNAIVRIIDDDDEIAEAYNEFRSCGLSDDELRMKQRKLEYQEERQSGILNKVQEGLEIYTHLQDRICFVLRVYEDSKGTTLFKALLFDDSYFIGEFMTHGLGEPTLREVFKTDDEEEADDIFIKQIQLIHSK